MKLFQSTSFTLVLTQFFSISSAYAQDAAAPKAAGASDFLVQLPLFVGLFFMMYFLLIRPQRQQQKQHAAFIAKIQKGEEVVTASGIIGKVTGLTDKVVTLEVSQGSELKILRSQIQNYFSPKDAPTTNAKK